MNNFFNISDLSKNDLLSIILMQDDPNALEGKNIGLIFEKYSTRTRLSFSVGINHLKGNSIDIKFEELNISRDESFEDTFKAINCYLDGLVYRTNSHQKLINASQYFQKPIINALSDQSHPCQIISDIFTIYEHFGSLKCHILWMGDMNNVCFSLVEAVNLIEDLKLTICTPAVISQINKWNLGQSISIVNSTDEVDLNSVNCVMTDVFISMNDNLDQNKINLLKSYGVNSELMSKTMSDSVFMHCLPAKIGLEVSEEVFRSAKSIVWKQAYNRMIAQQKLLQFIYQ